MPLSDEPVYFETASAPASTYDALREIWWWANGAHPTKSNFIIWECIEVWDGTSREAPASGNMRNLSAGNLWYPTATPSGSLPAGAWAVFRNPGGAVAAQFQIFVKMEAAGQAGNSLISLDDWTVGGGTGASPSWPATIIGQNPLIGDGDGRFPSSGILLWSMLMDEGMFLMKQFPTAAGPVVPSGITYMGEVWAATDEADDPRPFITPRDVFQGLGGTFSHVRLSPVDQSTICQLRNRPYYRNTQDDPALYNDRGIDYVSNIALDSENPAGHRFTQGWLRNVGAADEAIPGNRATIGYTGSDYRFEVFAIAFGQPFMVTRYPPGTPVGWFHLIIAQESVPIQLERPATIPPLNLPQRALKTIRHLLPKSRQWNLVYLRPFLQLMKGITPSLDAAADNADTVWTDLIPSTASTSALTNWERQFALGSASALTTAERRTRLEGVWASIGGQSPGYITETLQAHGFPVFTHEWWDLSSFGYPIPKDPRDYLLPAYGGTDTDGILLVNWIRTSVKFDEIGAGEAWAEAGEDRALAGYYGGYTIDRVGYGYVGPTTRHPYYLYIGGETFPNTVNIPLARKEEFESLCQKICPAQQWLVLRVKYV